MKAPFAPREAFSPPANYRLLPFRFNRLDERNVLTNDAGDLVVLSRQDTEAFVAHRLPTASPAYRRLKSNHFLFDDESKSTLDLLAQKYLSRSARVADFTALHMFVVTLRCDHSCHYCQVSRRTEDKTGFDMSHEHAEKALHHVFRSPSPQLKIEFQGGEPLLNFGLIRHVVERALELNVEQGKDLSFVIATNLSRLDDAVLAFCETHHVYLSTSLDGPKDLHDKQRPLSGGSSYETVVDGIQRARQRLGNDAVSALMTTTPGSLAHVEEVVDEYARQGFSGIFLRSLSPYGFAARSLIRRYDAAEWVAFYKRGLQRVLALNQSGYPMREEFTSILLQKMFSPLGTGYVDLQSPAGIGIGGIVYNYDGSVYASDEGRMLAEMGDTSFRLGHLDEDTYESIMTSDALLGPLHDTLLESAPMCSDCAYLPYCGADPVFHRATQGDLLGHKAFSAFCDRQTAVLNHLITLLEDDPKARDVLMGWV